MHDDIIIILIIFSKKFPFFTTVVYTAQQIKLFFISGSKGFLRSERRERRYWRVGNTMNHQLCLYMVVLYVYTCS